MTQALSIMHLLNFIQESVSYTHTHTPMVNTDMSLCTADMAVVTEVDSTYIYIGQHKTSYTCTVLSQHPIVVHLSIYNCAGPNVCISARQVPLSLLAVDH